MPTTAASDSLSDVPWPSSPWTEAQAFGLCRKRQHLASSLWLPPPPLVWRLWVDQSVSYAGRIRLEVSLGAKHKRNKFNITKVHK